MESPLAQLTGALSTADSAASGRLMVGYNPKKSIKAKKIKFLKSRLTNIPKAKKLKNVKYSNKK